MDRFRQALVVLAVVLAAAAAWRGGAAAFREAPGDGALLAQGFPPAPVSQEAHRDDRTLDAFKAITGRRLVAPPPPPPPPPVGPPPFVLLGTTYKAEAPQDSTAQVKNSQGIAKSYKVGETVLVDEAKLLAVTGPRARFLWHGREVDLGPEGPLVNPIVVTLGDPPLPAQTEFNMTPAEWKTLYGSALQLMTQIHVQVNMANGQPDGLRILSMDDKFFGRNYGLLPNDVVHSVNGQSLNTMSAVEGMMKTFSQPQSVSIEVQRGNRRFTLSIKVKP